jgi:signal transduction histidine kinase
MFLKSYSQPICVSPATRRTKRLDLFQRPFQNRVSRTKALWAYLHFGWPILGLIAMIGATGFLLLSDLAKEQDRSYVASSRELVQQSIDGLVDANAVYSTEYSLWNDAYQNVTLKENFDWLESNFQPTNANALGVFRKGVGMRYLFVKDGSKSARRDIESYVSKLSLSEHLAYQQTRDLKDLVVAPKALMVFDGNLAAVAVQPIRPEPDSKLLLTQTDAPLDFVVFVSYISPATIESIGRRSALTRPELHVTDAEETRTDSRIGIRVNDMSGKALARIEWQDARPGSSAFAERIVPISLILIGFGFLTIIVTHGQVARQMRMSELARLAAEEASLAKSSFLANVSHELRTPLNAIIGYSEILEEDCLDAQNDTGAADAKKVSRSAYHLLALINDLLDHSKIEAGKMDLNPTKTALRPLVDDVAEALRARANERGNDLVVNCDPLIGDAILDGMRLKQCLLNLATNAVKFTRDGKITISARAIEQEGVAYLRFSIKDYGIGMSAQTINKLFVPFVQADEATSQKFGGTGLGLVITRRLVEAMGGSVSVESVEGQGSTFTLLVPRGMEWAETKVPAHQSDAIAA